MNALRAYYFFVFAMYAVVVPHYQLLLDASGYSPREVGLLIGIFEILGVAGPIVFGEIADRTGRFRELKILGTMSAGVVFAVLIFKLPLAAALVVSGIAGFLFKTSVPLTDAVAGTVLQSPREEYGKVRVMGSIGFAVTSVIIPAFRLINPDSAVSILIAFIGSILAFSAVVYFVPPPLNTLRRSGTSTDGLVPPEGTKTAVSSDGSGSTAPSEKPRNGSIPPSIWLVIAAIGLGNIAFGAYNSFFSLYLRNTLSVTSVTLYWAIGALSEIPIIFYSGKLIRRFGMGFLLTVSGALMSVRLIAYALEPALPVVALIQLLHAVTFGLMLSAGIAYVNHVAPAERRATALTAFNALGMGMAVFLGSIIGGYVIEAFGFTGMYGVMALFPAGGALFIGLLWKRDPFLRRFV